MAQPKLTKTRLTGGVWEGHLSGTSSAPDLVASHAGTPIDGPVVAPVAEGDGWHVRLEIPASCIGDGVQVFAISDAVSGDTLASFALFSDDVAPDDVLAELHLLRAELDLLKRAFRRHCVETAG